MNAEPAERATAEESDDETAEPRVETVSVGDGRTVAYAEYGATARASDDSGTGTGATADETDPTPVALFHGTPGSHLLGELYAEEARRRGVRLLAIERPGYGDSTPWPDRTPTDAAEYLRAVLDDAGVSDVGLVAFSGGAAHALAVGATCDELVREIDLVSGAAPPSLADETPAAIRLLGTLAERTPRAFRGLVGVQTWVAERGPSSVVVGQYTADTDEVPDEEAAVVRRDFVRALGDRCEGMRTESAQAVEEWDFSLADVTVPVRLWHGARDENVPVAGARRLGERLPDAETTVFEDEDHLTTLLRSRSEVLGQQASGGSEE
ncbi:alpha/beta fold hydrolase [Halorussus salinus]|uniref:alpha/beta fold hydrolase n=1 Tax=Halorussus salinus TaxID=1364935 RepID=UPI001092CAEC|nr:alpha/beta hydrolase [Halorussus salinus]